MDIDNKHYVLITAFHSENSYIQNLKGHQDLLVKLLDVVKWDAKVEQVNVILAGTETQMYAVEMPEQDISNFELFSDLQDGLIDLGKEFEQNQLILLFPDDCSAAYFPLSLEGEMDCYPLVELDEFFDDIHEYAEDYDCLVINDTGYFIDTDNPVEGMDDDELALAILLMELDALLDD